MNLSAGEHELELLQAQALLWNHMFRFITTMSLKCAIELGILDIINNHGKPMTSSDLISALSINPTKARCVKRLMRILVQSGFFSIQKVDEERDEEGYVITSASKILLKDHPLSVTPFFMLMFDPTLITPWHHASSWFKNDDPTPFDTAFGRTFWDYAGHEPKLNHLFNEAMAIDSRVITSVLINEQKGVFEGLKSLVDVGGGTGGVGKAIAKAFPHLDCAILDLPQVVEGLEGSDNLKFIAGNMFDTVPPADSVLLRGILHDWNDEECVKILKRCKEAIKGSPGGKVIVVDMVMESKRDDYTTETQLASDVFLMVLMSGQERNEKEWAELFSLGGFSDYKITHIPGPRSLIEVFP